MFLKIRKLSLELGLAITSRPRWRHYRSKTEARLDAKPIRCCRPQATPTTGYFPKNPSLVLVRERQSQIATQTHKVKFISRENLRMLN